MEEYRKNNIKHTAKIIKRDICPKCGKCGKFRAHSLFNIKTGKISKFLQVDHYKWINGEKKYVYNCYIGVVK